MIPLTQIKPSRETALAILSGGSALGFSILTRRILAPRTILGDLAYRARLPRYGKRAKKVAVPFGYLGKEWPVLAIAAAVSSKLLKERRNEGAMAIMSATLAAIGSSHLFDARLPQKTPPPGRRAPADPHYPSGHALHSTTLLGIAAWVLSREGLTRKRALGAASAVLAFGFGFDRLVQDRHWTSDVVGGWLAAISIASAAALLYERSNPLGSSRTQSPL